MPLLLAGVTLTVAGLVNSPATAMVCIAAALTGLYSFKAPFWAVPTLFLSRATAAVSIAVINSIGNLGAGGLIFLAVLLFISFATMALMRLASDGAAQDVTAATSKTPA